MREKIIVDVMREKYYRDERESNSENWWERKKSARRKKILMDMMRGKTEKIIKNDERENYSEYW